MRGSSRTRLRLGGLLMLWAVMALLMVRSQLADPFDPSLEGTARYGHNGDGQLLPALGATLIELAVLIAILRPWTYDRSWARSGLALLLFLPWTGAAIVWMMHAGGIVGVHALWLLAVDLLLAVSVGWSGLAALGRRAALAAHDGR